MAHIQSPTPSIPVRSTARTARWSCFLVAAAALQLSGCGGGDEAAPQAALATVGGAAPGLLALQAADPGAANCDTQVNDTQEKLLECVTLPGVRAHQAALAAIAKANGGTRLAGSPGFEASVAYARQVLTAAGYRVSVQPFAFWAPRILSSSLLEPGQAAAAPMAHQVVDYSGSGDVTALVSRPAEPSGCAASDFAGFVRGHIALIRRGACDLTDKLSHAVTAGASGLVIYSQDEDELTGSLSSDAPQNIPVVMVGKAVGEQLAQRSEPLHLQTETARRLKTAYNVLAESVDGDASHVTMLGAHLDSVRAGAGINDNGSGVAAVLETARQMARVKPVNQLRFALWGAEEQGLLGSTYYVRKLDATQRAQIALYLNFDMIGSPNPVFFVYGGDGSAGSQAISRPALSAGIVATLGDFYTQRQVPFKWLGTGARSDHQPFADVGIPFGGIFTGAEGIKTAKEAKIWGGTAGKAYDPCYHRACDNMANNSDAALETNAHAVAHAALFFAMNPLPQ